MDADSDRLWERIQLYSGMQALCVRYPEEMKPLSDLDHL